MPIRKTGSTTGRTTRTTEAESNTQRQRQCAEEQVQLRQEVTHTQKRHQCAEEALQEKEIQLKQYLDILNIQSDTLYLNAVVVGLHFIFVVVQWDIDVVLPLLSRYFMRSFGFHS